MQNEYQTSDKIVCVDDTPRPTHIGASPGKYRFPSGMVEKGRVYAVAGMRHNPNGLVGVLLVGKPALGTNENGDWSDAGWSPHRFRSMVEIRASAILSKADAIALGGSRNDFDA